ncbi:tetratricopeptide (TPR) repeat protein [Bradyrhizobium sp. LB1.3]
MLFALSFAAAHAATGGEPAAVPQVDVAPCLAAAAADDIDKAATACAAVIDNEKAAKGDLIKALIARGALFARHDQIDRAIADDSRALLLDSGLADIFNARGELWLRKGDKPKAVQDFGAALKIDPNHEKAKVNHKAMAREIERIGAQMAVAGKPSFSCKGARAVPSRSRSAPTASSPISTARFLPPMPVCSARPATRAKRRRFSASRTISSPAAMPDMAGPATI